MRAEEAPAVTRLLACSARSLRRSDDLFELSCGDRVTLVDAAVFVLLSCREVVSPSMGSQCRLIGTMKVINFLGGLGRTQMIYTALRKALFLGPVIRGDEHRCGRTSAFQKQAQRRGLAKRITLHGEGHRVAGKHMVVGKRLHTCDWCRVGPQRREAKGGGLGERPGGSRRIKNRSMGDNKGKGHKSQHQPCGRLQAFLWPQRTLHGETRCGWCREQGWAQSYG